ncbi:IclR family transcriptional regulator C-terminal domain-containing protein [Actinomadura sp. SCN-SB]|uniref:IclR family transcriptional regulator domain-containing protein n=1 Tax=Actinomadura sp. SCN-SB TaxID=3373092 RepID=UPI003753458D
MPAPVERGEYYVQSLDRGLAVLRAFEPGSPRLTLTEVARRTGLTRAAARRFLHTLHDLHYVHFDGRTFGLRPRVLELGNAYLSSIRLPDIALPHLGALTDKVRETVSLTVLDGQDVLYIARVHGVRILSESIAVGTRAPAYATSTGRVLLAGRSPEEVADHLARAELRSLTDATITDPRALAEEIDRTRRQGWAIADQERFEDMRSIAAPVRDHRASVVAAVNISAHITRASVEVMRREWLPELLATASRIEADLEHSA